MNRGRRRRWLSWTPCLAALRHINRMRNDGWRCDLCGETVTTEERPLVPPGQCSRCSSSRVAYATTWSVRLCSPSCSAGSSTSGTAAYRCQQRRRQAPPRLRKSSLELLFKWSAPLLVAAELNARAAPRLNQHLIRRPAGRAPRISPSRKIRELICIQPACTAHPKPVTHPRTPTSRRPVEITGDCWKKDASLTPTETSRSFPA
jgi:hypothetical protein